MRRLITLSVSVIATMSLLVGFAAAIAPDSVQHKAKTATVGKAKVSTKSTKKTKIKKAVVKKAVAKKHAAKGKLHMAPVKKMHAPARPETPVPAPPKK
jgi:hypothetical protein